MLLHIFKLFSFSIDPIVFERICMCYELLLHPSVKAVKFKQSYREQA